MVRRAHAGYLEIGENYRKMGYVSHAGDREVS